MRARFRCTGRAPTATFRTWLVGVHDLSVLEELDLGNHVRRVGIGYSHVNVQFLDRDATDVETIVTRTEGEALLPEQEIEAWVRARDVHIVAATVGEDEHSVGLHEILDIKHGGIEKYGFQCHILGTSIGPGQLLDEAERLGARAILISTIVTHSDVHRQHMNHLHEQAGARGLRDRLLLVAGGTQITDEMARECHMDAGFGRGTTGRQVASFLVRALRERAE